MRRWIVAALLLLCLPVVGRGQSIRYYPDSTSYTLGKTESGILYRAASANPTLLDGLVSYWPLDEISGVRYDAVGTNHLTDNNTVGSVINAGDAMDGAAASFVAANSEYLSAAASLLSTPAWATSFWFNSTSASKILFVDGTTETYLLFTSGGTATMYVATDGSPNYTGHTVTLALPTGWVHLIIEVDSSGITSTLNGVTSSTTALNGNLRSGVATFKVGSSGAGFFMDGQADEVAIWSRVLSEAERTELYNSGAGKFYTGSVFAYLSYQQPWRYAANDNTPDWLFQAFKRPPRGLSVLKKAS